MVAPDGRRPLPHVAFLVLSALAERPLHEYGIIAEARSRARGRLRLEAATLYAALKRLRADGLIDLAAGMPSTGARGQREYTLTEAGKTVLAEESGSLARLREMSRGRRPGG